MERKDSHKTKRQTPGKGNNTIGEPNTNVSKGTILNGMFND